MRESVKLRIKKKKLQALIVYHTLLKYWFKAKLEFWKIVAGIGTEPTPEQSEKLTGIEVKDRDE